MRLFVRSTPVKFATLLFCEKFNGASTDRTNDVIAARILHKLVGARRLRHSLLATTAESEVTGFKLYVFDRIYRIFRICSLFSTA